MMGTGGAITEAERKIIRRYGSKENYHAYQAQKKLEKEVAKEIEDLGLNSVTNVDEYERRYNQASATTKKYLDTPAQFKTHVKEQQTKLIENNKVKIAKAIEAKQKRIADTKAHYEGLIKKVKSKGRNDLVDKYEDRMRIKLKRFKGEIKGLQAGIGQAVDFKEIDIYASKLGRYQKQKYEYQLKYSAAKKKAKDIEPQQVITIEDIPAQIIKQTPRRVDTYRNTTGRYVNIDDITIGRRSLITGATTIDIKPGAKIYTSPDKTGPSFDAKNLEWKKRLNIKAEKPKDIGGFKAGEFGGQGTTMFTPRPIGIPTQSEQYIAQEQLKDELVTLKSTPDYVDREVNVYNYGQGTQMVTGMEGGKLLYTKPGDIIHKTDRVDLSKARDKRIKEIEGLQAFSTKVDTPTLRQVQSESDQRGTFETILRIGDEPKISGAQLTYATGKILGEMLEEQMQKDYEVAYEKKMAEVKSKINVNAYQKRIDAGEDFKIVQKELDKEYEKANRELQKFTEKFQKEWIATQGKAMEKTSQKLYFSTQHWGKAKDTEAKIGDFFVKGAITGGATTAGSAAIVAAVPAAAPVLMGAGLVAGGAMTGVAIGKSIVTGEGTYADAQKLGFTRKESLAYGLVAGATDVAPFAFTGAGAMAGGLLVGGGLRYIRKPVTTRHSVAPPRQTVKASGTISHKGKVTIGGKEFQAVKYPKQKIAEIGVPGSRAETTTKWRTWFHAKPVATGYPADVKGHAKAIKLYREYGLSTSQAKKVTQFIKPQMIEQYIAGGYSYSPSKNLASGYVDTKQKWLKITMDKKLGVETEVKPTKITRSVFSRISTTPNKDYSGFMELDVTGSGQKNTITLQMPGIRTGVTKQEDWSSPFGSKVIDITSSDSQSFHQRMYGTGKQERAINYLIKNIRDTPRKYGSRGTSVTRDTPSTSETFTHQARRSGGIIKLTQDTNSRINPLLKIAPPVQSITTTTSAPPITKVNSYSMLSALFIPSVAVAETTSLNVSSNIKSKQIQTPLLTPRQELKNLQLFENTQQSFREQMPSQGSVQAPVSTQPPATTPSTPGGATNIPSDIPSSPIKGDPGFNYPIIVDIDFGGGRRYTENIQPYQGQVLVKGKYQTVTEKPHTKKGAFDKIAKIIDNTIAVQGRVVPIGKKKIPKNKAVNGDGYYGENKQKFRGFKMFKGRPVPMRDTIIEKKNKRLDTKGEQSQISVAKFTANLAKKAAGKPVRKKKSKKKIPFI